VEPPIVETASIMPYRGAANASPPPAAGSRPPQAIGAGFAPANGPVNAERIGVPTVPNNPVVGGGSAAPPAVGPRQNPPLGLDGYCPVTLVEREKWVKGDPKFGAHHQGRTYLFASAEAQAKFLQDQGYQKYAPALSGYDPVKYAERGELVDGKRVHGVFFHNQVFLFADEAGLQQFWADPERYATIVRAEHARSAMRTNTQR
jgi:protein disulfide-isomerase